MKYKRTYREAAHAMQTGVAMKMKVDPAETTAKHLRVGVNSAMVETAAIVQLLINKGIATLPEFEEELANQMNLEADRYALELKNLGINAELL
jgi:hypothetical protein